MQCIFCTSNPPPSESTRSSEFIDLFLRIPHLLQIPLQLPLIRRLRLDPADGFIQPRRPADEKLDVFLLRLRQHGLEQVLRDPALSLRPVVAGLVEDVEGSEALRVFVLQVFELAFQEDVLFGDVAEDEGDFCFVVGVFEDCAAELVHPIHRRGGGRKFQCGGKGRGGGRLRCDASSSSYQGDVVVFVGFPRIFW